MRHLLNLLAGWYAAVWPNLAASAITFTAGMVWHQRRMTRLLAWHHAAQADATRAYHAGLRAHLDRLHERFDALAEGRPQGDEREG